MKAVSIESSRRFVVNVLGQGQESLALQFARPAETTDKFADVSLRRWLAATPAALVREHLHVGDRVLAALSGDERPVAR